MFLSDVSIGRPVFTAMMSVALIVFGLLSYRSLPVDQFPRVDFPIMLVQTVYPGATPEDIERDISEPIEDAVASTPGIDQLQSFSRDNVSLVVLQFKMGTNLTDAVSIVRDRVGTVVGDLPSGAEAPVIRQIDIGALPVMVIALASPQGVNETRTLAEDRLRPFLEQVPGVGSVNVLGGQDREIQVELNLDALAALGIPPTQVAERLGWENLSLPVGQFDQQGFTIGVRADGHFTSIEDLKSAAVHITQDGRQIQLGEVANVRDTFSRAQRYVRFNGHEAVSLEVVKRSGANTVELAHGVTEALETVVPTLGPGVTYDIISDQSHDIEANAHEVWIAIWFGGAAAVAVILFFLLDIRGTLISALALPTSVIGTFAAMGALGFSLNTMTLLGLSLAIGLLIDDAVVVREAITRRLEAGDSPKEAASRGTREIALAVLATTLSLVAVFVPVAFMSGMVGQFFKEFGLTIAISVLLSLFVAFTLDPMLSSRFSTTHVHGQKRGIPARWIETILDGIDASYRRILNWTLRWRVTTVGIAVMTLFCAGFVSMFIPVEFVPKEDRGEVIVDVRQPVGSSLSSTKEWADKVEAELLQIKGVERVYTIVGHEDQAHRARFRIRAIPKSERTESIHFFEDAARRIGSQVPGAEVSLSKPGVIDGLGDWPPLLVIVQGDDMTALRREAERVKAVLQSIEGTSDVRLSVAPGRPELRLDIDRTVAADRGVPTGLVASTARLLVEGNIIGPMNDDGAKADIRVLAAPQFANDPAAIAALPLPSPRGRIALGEVAKVGMSTGPSEIQHTDRQRSINISVQLGPKGALGQIVTDFQAAMEKDPLRDGVHYKISGEASDMEDTQNAMGLAIVIALTFIFMVLASQFESLLHPFTLLVSVPLALVGAFFALFITGLSFSMGSAIALVLLMGLVTKNAILLVDGALSNMRDGMEPLEAMRAAGPRRLRPILMTSAAMVFGMLPTALGNGIGAEFRAPMAVAVIGGVISSTLLTLLVVPIVFVWMEGLKNFVYRLFFRTPAPSPAQAQEPEPSPAK